MLKTELGMDKWFESSIGKQLLELEASFIAKLIASKWGDHCVQIGGPADKLLRCASPIIHQLYLKSHIISVEEASLVVTAYDELPLMPHSADLILLPHVLECVKDPHAFLSEVYQALKPEGLLIILCFNPAGVGALWRLQLLHQGFPHKAKWWSTYRLMEYLQIIGYSEIQRYSVAFQPWINREVLCGLFPMDKILAWICGSLGAVSVLSAKKEEAAPLWQRADWKAVPALGAMRNNAFRLR